MQSWIFYIIASAICTLAGLALTKRWIDGHQPVYYIIALAVFALSSVAYMQALKFQRMAILEVFWGTMMALLVIGMGVLVYNEKIGVQEGVGIVLALTASVLLTVKF